MKTRYFQVLEEREENRFSVNFYKWEGMLIFWSNQSGSWIRSYHQFLDDILRAVEKGQAREIEEEEWALIELD